MPKKKKQKKKQKKVLSTREQQDLPAKLNNKLQNTVKLYELGQYGKGVKEADKILQEYPENGETLAMKGLCLLNVNVKANAEESKKLIQDGLKRNIKSQICWHTKGLMHRHLYDYKDAARCLMQAVRVAKTDDARILADLAQLHIHERDYERFTALRQKLLPTKPSQRANWVGCSLGSYLCGRLDRCLQLQNAWWETSRTLQEGDPENNELLFLCVKALHEDEQKEISEALSFLKDKEQYFTNKYKLLKTEAAFLEEAGEYEEAIERYKLCIERNPDNESYYDAIIRIHEKSETEIPDVLSWYDKIALENSAADVPKRLPLFIATGEDFKSRVDTYMKQKLRKSVPSLFNLLRELLGDEAKRLVIRKLMEQYIQQLREHRRFSEGDEEGSESPGVLIWALYIYGCFCDNQNEPETALDVVQQCLDICPNCIDAKMLRARIYKHQGNFSEAYKWMDEARGMDTADRYLNTKCTRFAFRAGCWTRGEWTIRQFLRPSDGLECIEELQVVWYPTAKGIGHSMFLQHRKALEQFERVYHTYEGVWNDQFDFHHYALRKATVVTYLEMLRWEEELRRQPFFVKSAKQAIRTYLLIHDLAAKGKNFEEEQRPTKDEEPPSPIPKDKKKRFEPEDFTGKPLEAALRWVKHLLLVLRDDIDTFILAAGIYRRSGKILLALRNLKKAISMDPSNPNLLFEIFCFVREIQEKRPDDIASSHINIKELLLETSSLPEFLEMISKKHDTLIHQCKVLECRLQLGEDVSTTKERLTQLKAPLLECKEVIDSLKRCGQMSKPILDNFKRQWPFSTIFVFTESAV